MKWGFIDANKRVISKAIYDSVGHFNIGIASVSQNDTVLNIKSMQMDLAMTK